MKERPDLFGEDVPGGIRILKDVEEIRQVEIEKAQELAALKMPIEYALVGIVYQDQYLRIVRDAVEFPVELSLVDGTKQKLRGTYIRVISPRENSARGVIVFPVYRGQVLLIRIFRHATRSWHLEVPRGFGEHGLASEETICNELKGEIGATVSRLVPLGQLHPNTGAGAEIDDLFFAEIEEYGEPQRAEAISDILPISLATFEQMLRDNEITDGFTMAAYTRARLYGLL